MNDAPPGFAEPWLGQTSEARQCQIATIVRNWDKVGDQAGLTIPASRSLWRRQCPNPCCLENYPLGIAIPERW